MSFKPIASKAFHLRTRVRVHSADTMAIRSNSSSSRSICKYPLRRGRAKTTAGHFVELDAKTPFRLTNPMGHRRSGNGRQFRGSIERCRLHQYFQQLKMWDGQDQHEPLISLTNFSNCLSLNSSVVNV